VFNRQEFSRLSFLYNS